MNDAREKCPHCGCLASHTNTAQTCMSCKKSWLEPPVRLDSLGRICPQPDPTDSPAFSAYAQVHGVEAARAAFGLWEDDPYA